MAFNRYFPFDSEQAKTLDKLLGEAGPVTPQANETTIGTADATDLASAIALANATKAKVNALIVKLRAAGILV